MPRLLAAALVVLALSPPGRAQEAPAAPAASDEQGGVEFALRRYIVVFNTHDADRLAALWTPGAIYVDRATGERTEGRDALAADFRDLFAASPEIRLSGEVEEIRILGDNIAMVDGTTTTVAPDAEPTSTAYSAIFVKSDGKWLLDSVHETPLPSPETPRQALAPLAWLVGQWQDAAEAGSVETTVRWSPNEAFLIRSYGVNRGSEESFEGTQIIAWDPRSKHIRSWTFNSDGSFGEAVWSESDGEWLVRTAQTLPDGRAATATQVIKKIDDDTATVQTIAKEIDGAPEPASEPIMMSRVAEQPAAAAASTSAADASEVPIAAAAGATP